jgi:hypothetical protein
MMRLKCILALGLVLFFLAGCGGGGGNDPAADIPNNPPVSTTPPPTDPDPPPATPTTHTVTASATSGGSIDPTSRSVVEGNTTTFTVAAQEGFAIEAVTGCGGSLSGNTFTTAAITAPCTVSASFSLVVPPPSPGDDDPLPEGVNQALLGPLAGAEIRAYRLTDLITPVEGPITADDSMDDLWIAGTFELLLAGIPDEEWILVTATGGWDIDADDDGVLDEHPTENRGTIHALGRAIDWVEGGRTINVLSEIAWRVVRADVLAGQIELLEDKLQWITASLLRDDLNDDDNFDYRDLIGFRPERIDHRDLLQVLPTDLRPVTEALLAGSDSQVDTLLTQRFGTSLNLPKLPELVEVVPEVVVPANREDIQAGDVIVRSFLSDKAEIDMGGGSTLLVGQDDEGRTLLLGYAMPQATSMATVQPLNLAMAPQIRMLTGSATTSPTISPESTAFALVMTIAGSSLSDELRAEIAALVLAHEQYDELVDLTTETFEANPYFLDTLALYSDLVDLIIKVAQDSFSQLLAMLDPEGEEEPANFVTPLAASQSVAMMSSYDLNKTFCKGVPSWLCFSAWKRDEPWDWYGSASAVNVWGKPFMAVNTSSRDLLATANPGLVNFSLQFYDQERNLLGWKLVPRSSTLVQKLIHSGAAQREIIVGRDFPRNTDHVEFHKYRFTFNNPGTGAAQVSGLNLFHLIGSTVNLVSSASGEFLKGATEKIAEVDRALAMFDCFQSAVGGVDYYPDTHVGDHSDQLGAFLSNNWTSLAESTFMTCGPMIFNYVIKDRKDELISVAAKAGKEVVTQFSNPAGWARLLLKATNDFIPFATSYFTPTNSPAIYKVDWNSNDSVNSFTTLGGRPDPDNGTIRVVPVADFLWTQGNGLTVYFDASSSQVDPNTTPSYEWFFSDGPSIIGDEAQYTFSHSGTHTVRLRLTDGFGQVSEEIRTIQVTNGRPPEIKDMACYASPHSTTVNVAVEVTDPDNDVIGLLWYLSPGHAVPVQMTTPSGNKVDSVSLVYADDGITSFSPMLVAVDAGGNEAREVCYVKKGEVGDAEPPPVSLSSRLNDTGMVLFSDPNSGGWHEEEPSSWPGQDAAFGRDALASAGQLTKTGGGAAGFDFTKLDDNGNPLPSNATKWSCVRDNVTGLVWEVKTTDGGVHDVNDRYLHNEAFVFADSVNDSIGLCGYTDWRIPKRFELESIVHYGSAFPGLTIDTDFFPNMLTNQTDGAVYWAKEFSPDLSEYSAVVQFSWGGAYFSSGYTVGVLPGKYVRLVRGTTLTPTLTDNFDGTVSDEVTGLIWKKCSEGQTWNDATNGCDGSSTSYSWQNSLLRAKTVNTNADGENLGYNDWRLPNIKELSGIIDLSQHDPAINTGIFPSTPSSWFWSSTPRRDNGSVVWLADFKTGDCVAAWISYLAITEVPIRLVRGGH